MSKSEVDTLLDGKLLIWPEDIYDSDWQWRSFMTIKHQPYRFEILNTVKNYSFTHTFIKGFCNSKTQLFKCSDGI
jgi:hypothetical protein